MLKNQQRDPAPSPRSPANARLWLFFALVTALGLAADLGSKQWAWDALRPPGGHARMLWSPTLELAFAFNTGSAFSLVNFTGTHRALFVLITALAIAYPLLVVTRMPGANRWRFAALGLIVSGALGNLHDRVLRLDHLGRHGVVDFIKVNYPWGGSWPTFNVADVTLVVGVGLLLIHMWRVREAPPAPAMSSP